MTRGARAQFAMGLSIVALLGLALVAGCNKQPDNSSAPGGPDAGGPGRPGGMMGGPGGMMGGPGGRGMMGGGPVAENATGAEIFQQKCQGCHGATGKGGRGGPSLAKAAGSSEDAIGKIIHDGKGRMPAFGSQLKEDQIKKVAAEAKKLASST